MEELLQNKSLQDIKIQRLQSQIEEMSVENQCQRAQIETIEGMNASLQSQIYRLEQ